MSEAYSKRLSKIIKETALELGIELKEGVYLGWRGPSFETPAEVRMVRILGADVVGMSTVPEVIVANHMKLPCAAISVLTDECDPDNLKEAKIQDIIKTAEKAEVKLIKLFTALIEGYYP